MTERTLKKCNAKNSIKCSQRGKFSPNNHRTMRSRVLYHWSPN